MHTDIIPVSKYQMYLNVVHRVYTFLYVVNFTRGQTVAYSEKVEKLDRGCKQRANVRGSGGWKFTKRVLRICNRRRNGKSCTSKTFVYVWVVNAQQFIKNEKWT